MPRAVIVPENFGLDDVDPEVAEAFQSALAALANAGVAVRSLSLDFFDQYRALPVWQFSAVESRAHHGQYFDADRDRLDPRVASRMARADEVTAVDYARTLYARDALVAEAACLFADTPVVLPTVAVLPPRLDALQDSAAYDRINLLALRNTSLANIIDGCSISMPLRDCPDAGLMLTAPAGRDGMVLAMAETLSGVL